jgi:LppX_LprAFG lipoprotein
MWKAMRRLAFLLLLPVLAFVAAGCGSGGALELDPVASAATKTQQTGTYAFDFTASVHVLGRPLSFSGSGQVDGPNGALDMQMDFGSLLPASLTQGAPATADVRLVDKVAYVNMPFLASKLPSGKPWLKLDLRSLAGSAGLGSVSQSDPQQYLQQLLASKNTQTVGTDTIAGEKMTHYRTTIDPSARLGALPADVRAAARKALKQLGTKGIPADVWVDSQGLLRRESVSLAFGQALQGASMSMTMNFHDFGTPVDVAAPPADQTFDATSLVPSAKPKP